jgi:predicted DNA-binding transcriptional regulator AlpA
MSTAVAPEPPAVIDVKALAALLCVSERHVWRMHDRGALPECVRIGACVRWRRQDIDAWIRDGCKPIRQARRG